MRLPVLASRPPDPGACRICGGPLAGLASRTSLPLARCATCRVICLEPEPDPVWLRSAFSDGYFSGAAPQGYGDYLGMEASHRAQARRRLALLPAPKAGAASRLLDIGCAAGFLLDEAQRAGWNATGVESNASMAAAGRALPGVNIVTGDVHTPVAGAPFDAIVLLNVLEHLTAPRAVEARLGTLLRSGGHLMIETWNADALAARLQGRRWHQWSPLVPYYHVRRSLDALFTPARWELVRWQRAAKWIPLWRAAEIVARGVLHDAARSRRPWRWEVPYLAGDLVLAIYRRR